MNEFSKQYSRYINRELSWLEFNQRVLDQALDESNPLLERVKFLAITASNLDEFFKIRVGGLKISLKTKTDKPDLIGMTADQQLNAIRKRVREMYATQSQCLGGAIGPQLKDAGIIRVLPDEIDDRHLKHLSRLFKAEIESVISPISVAADQEFPLLAGAKLCLCVRLKLDASVFLGATDDTSQPERFVIVPLGKALSRFISLPSESGFSFMTLEDVVGMFLDRLLPNQEILDWTVFRATRNADIAVDDMMHDLLAEMTELLEKRKISECVRLEVAELISQPTLDFLKEVFQISDEDVYRIDGPIDLSAFFELASISGFTSLRDKPWPPQIAPVFATGQNIFDVIAASDRVLFHPYHSYDPVIEFLRAAADDPNVIAIKQTLYRSSRNSEIMSALADAATNGKSVTAIVELKARFDEARNIQGARRLEQAGVDVIYGVQGLKTHAKICIVVRREEERGIQRYLHFGTGNYNETTATLYSDVSYFTNHAQLGNDAVHFFNAITGLSVPQHLELLAAAPIDLRDRLLELIEIETRNQRQGGTGAINAKLNSLADQKIIDALYEASSAGVEIRLNVRGICCLRPGVSGLSENIRVISIVDRMLEHARIFHFLHGGDDQIYIASADWMPRNLDRRVELLVPIQDKDCRNRILSHLMTYYSDNVKATMLTSDAQYIPVSRGNKEPFRAQEYLYLEACEMYSAFSNPKATVFKARRGDWA